MSNDQNSGVDRYASVRFIHTPDLAKALEQGQDNKWSTVIINFQPFPIDLIKDELERRRAECEKVQQEKSDPDRKFSNFAKKVLLVVDERRKNNLNFKPNFIQVSSDFYDGLRRWFKNQYPFMLDLKNDAMFIYGIQIHFMAGQEVPIMIGNTGEEISLV